MSASPPTPWVRWHAVIIIVAALAVYADAFGNAFVWDDLHLVVGNAAIKHWGRLPGLWGADLFPDAASHYYRPLQAVTYALDYQIWKLTPFGYHLTNTLLHAGVAVLFYRFVTRLLGMPRAAFIAALLFAVHPIHTQAVAYISGRSDPLAALFLLAALLCFAENEPERRRFTWWRAGSLAAFTAALFARETTVELVPLIVLVDLTLSRRDGVPLRGSWRNRVLIRYLPYAGVFLLYLGTRLHAVGSGSLSTPLAAVPLALRLATMLEVIVRYVGLLVVPVHLHMERTVLPPRSLWTPGVLGAALLVSGAIALTFSIRRRAWPVAFGVAWFLIALIPVSNVVPLATFMAEHWIYVPSLGLFLAAGWTLDRAMTGSRRAAVIAVTGIALAAYGGLTARRNRDWMDETTIYETTLREAPESTRVAINLGDAYRRHGQLARAEDVLRQALAHAGPGNDPHFAGVHNNLGLVLRDLGHLDEERQEFEAALRIDPRFADAYGNLGNYYSNHGQLPEALEAYGAALRLDPESAKAHNNLATLYFKIGRLDLAEQELRRALELDPDLDDVRRNLAMVLHARAAPARPR